MNYARLGDRGVEALSYALTVNRIVKGLYLKHCQVTSVGVKHLFQSLLVRMNAEGAKELLESAVSDIEHDEESVCTIRACRLPALDSYESNHPPLVIQALSVSTCRLTNSRFQMQTGRDNGTQALLA